MKTLILYDNTGYIYLQIRDSENRLPQGGIQFLEIEIPEGKTLKSIDVTVTPNVPVYEDIPLTEIEKVNTQMTTILKSLIK
ncbi:hypothetical protein CLPUN_18490 [Clostridium puniceum]|uniref:Uncharacterized protein n=1 Tax=Clostridium puniceum TaxID=29367 RepID=A0A1S8TM02_9CLOT|nr:hypothetical protein [Clostridium puniceum]OOM78622.1 hypothetical protein CLPUN_18490 [Clostridium puniceum]